MSLMLRQTGKDSWKKRRGQRLKANKSTADAIAKKRGGRCLSSPRRVHDKWKWKCAKSEHKPWLATLAQVKGAGRKKGSWCPYCGGTAKVARSVYEQWAKRFSGKLISMADVVTKPSLWWCKHHGKFDRRLCDMQTTGNFCPDCSRSLGERKCKAAMEQLFGKPFVKKRFTELKGKGGKALELDLYNDELSLALEHQGAQHFIPKKYFKVHRLNEVMEHDRRKRKFCAARGITLIEIRQVGDATPDSQLKEAIRRALVAKGFALPKGFDLKTLKLDAAALPSLTQEKWEQTKSEAHRRGWKVVSRIYLGSLSIHNFICDRGHSVEIKPSHLLQGQGCWRCEQKPVVLDDSRLFDSVTAAANAIGASISTLSFALRHHGRARGRRAAFITHRRLAALGSMNANKRRREVEKIFRTLPVTPRVGEAHSIPVILGDGRIFSSSHEAARAVGVNENIAHSASKRPKGKIAGIRIARIDRETAKRFSKNAKLVEQFWLQRPIGPRKFMTRRRGILTSKSELFEGVREAADALSLKETQVCDAARRGTETKSRQFWHLCRAELAQAKKTPASLRSLLHAKQQE